MIVPKKFLVTVALIVVAIGGLLTFPVPDLVHDWNAMREGQAIAAIRSIAAAQYQLQASGAIDTDGDGEGEYGFLVELMGIAPLRGPEGAPENLLDPPLLPISYGEVVTDSRVHGVVRRQDYLFKVYLPAARSEGFVPAMAEAPTRGVGQPDGDEAEQSFCVYAWPDRPGYGRYCFFLNEVGEILRCTEPSVYFGLQRGPAFDAAYSRPGQMSSPIAGLEGRTANDGYEWAPIGN